MGMLDQELIFSDAQPQTGNFSTGDNASTNIYNTGGSNGQGDAGQTGENLWVNAFVNTTATSGGSATIQAVFQDSADGTNFNDVLAGPAVAVANATAGTALLQVQPPVGTRQYWRVVFRIGTAALTAGKFDAYLSNTIQRNITRKSGLPAIL